MKNLKSIIYIIVIVITTILYCEGSIQIIFDLPICKNNFWFFCINIVFAILMFFLFSFLHETFSFSRKPIFNYFWAISVLGIYFFLGYFLTGNIFVKQQSYLMNLLSFSVLPILGMALVFLLYLDKGRSSGGGWISIPNVDWLIYMGIFPYSLCLSDYVDTKGPKRFFALIPILPSVMVWLGMEFKV